jgi:hypothetical protein
MTDEETGGKIKEVVELSEEEVANRAQTLAAKTIEIAIMKNDLKEASSSARGRIKEMQATIDELADQVKTRQMTRYVDRQPGLFDGKDDDDEEAAAADTEGEEGAPAEDDEPLEGGAPVPAGAACSEGPNPGPLPPGAEITDPAAVMGPPLPPSDKGKGKGRARHEHH